MKRSQTQPAVRRMAVLRLATSRTSDGHSLLSRLNVHAHQILNHWELKVGHALPQLQHLLSHEPLNVKSEYFEALVQVIASPSKLPDFLRVAASYGTKLAENPEITLKQVSIELRQLRKAIFECLFIDGPINDEDRETILDLIDSGTAQSVEAFVELRSHSELEAKIESVQYVNRLKLALDGAKTALWEWDVSSDLVWHSENLGTILDLSFENENLSFESFLAHIHSLDRARVTIEMKELLTGNGTSLHTEYRIQAPDQSIRWISGRVLVYRNKAGSPVRLAGAITDITENKHAKELEAQFLAISRMDLKKLKEEREIRDKFISTLSHDIKSPLSSMKTGAQMLLRRKGTPETQDRIAGRIVSGVDRADRMIEDLLDASRFRAGRPIPISISECNLVTVVADALEASSLNFGDRLILDAPQKEIQGYWCIFGVRRILDSLINNAVKYGCVDSMITVSLTSEDNKVWLSVHNEGPGLTSEELSTMFEPFRKVKSAEDGEKKGWGLGLTLVRGIAEAHGGKVSVKSAPLQGATFIVELPLDSRSYQRVQK